MNAGDNIDTLTFAHAIASSTTLVKQYFPAARVNLNPWHDDPQTRKWFEKDSLDLSFHFPGWSPRLQCRSLLLQLRFDSSEYSECFPYLIGVLMRGMTYEGERWRLVTLGEWEPQGSYLPHPAQTDELKEICRGLFTLFPKGPS